MVYKSGDGEHAPWPRTYVSVSGTVCFLSDNCQKAIGLSFFSPNICQYRLKNNYLVFTTGSFSLNNEPYRPITYFFCNILIQNPQYLKNVDVFQKTSKLNKFECFVGKPETFGCFVSETLKTETCRCLSGFNLETRKHLDICQETSKPET